MSDRDLVGHVAIWLAGKWVLDGRCDKWEINYALEVAQEMMTKARESGGPRSQGE